MHLTPAKAKALGLDLSPKEHGAKVKADIAHGKSLVRGVIVQVLALTKIEGLAEYREWSGEYGPLDAAWPVGRIALELQGHRYHHRRADFERWFLKHAAATRQGWRVFYATADQCRKCAALWISAVLTISTGEK